MYYLMDDTGNFLGEYRSERAALRVAADAVRRYGIDSEAVLGLELMRSGLAPDQAQVAHGRELAERAIVAA